MPYKLKNHSVKKIRNNAATRGYNYQWSRISRNYITNHPICENCKTRLAELTHHKLPIKNGGSNDDWNLMSVCRKCHDEIHDRLNKNTT